MSDRIEAIERMAKAVADDRAEEVDENHFLDAHAALDALLDYLEERRLMIGDFGLTLADEVALGGLGALLALLREKEESA